MVVIVRGRKHGSRRRRVVARVLVVMLIRVRVWVRRSCGEDDSVRWRFCGRRRRRWRKGRRRWSGGWKGVAPPLSTASTFASAAAYVSHMNSRNEKDEIFRERRMMKSKKVLVLVSGSEIGGLLE